MDERREVKRYPRRSMRLREYDYAQAGTYFVTVCTYQRACIFGEVAHDMVRVNSWGEVVAITWNGLADKFGSVILDAFVIMPNHVHGIIVINNANASRGEAEDNESRLSVRTRSSSASPYTVLHMAQYQGGLGALIQAFKSKSTRRINAMRHTPGRPVWQRNYYERVIRHERELNAIRKYTAENPLRWALDIENPLREIKQ